MEPTTKHHPPVRAGVFESLDRADRAVQDLLDAGFPAPSISVVCPECSAGDLIPARQVEPTGSGDSGYVGAGSAIGGVLGGLTAAVGIAASGGVGLWFVGPLLGGLLAGGVAGGFVGAMATRGFEPEIADFYSQALEEGQILVSVEETSSGSAPALQRAEQVLRDAGARVVPLEKG